MEVIKVKEKSGMCGRVRITEYTDNTFSQIIAVKEYHNLITDDGFNAFMRGIAGAGTIANEGIATYMAVGSGTNVPNAANTTLQTELFRKQLVTKTVAANVITLSCFFTTAEGAGAWKEVGVFGEDASETANSGTLFNRAAIDVTKTTLKAVRIDIEWTLT